MKAIAWVILGIVIGGVAGFMFLFKQLHDAEEVVVLHADAQDLPLWIVESDGVAWFVRSSWSTSTTHCFPPKRDSWN